MICQYHLQSLVPSVKTDQYLNLYQDPTTFRYYWLLLKEGKVTRTRPTEPPICRARHKVHFTVGRRVVANKLPQPLKFKSFDRYVRSRNFFFLWFFISFSSFGHELNRSYAYTQQWQLLRQSAATSYSIPRYDAHLNSVRVGT